MRLDLIENDDPRIKIVEKMLINIEGVTPDSLYSNEQRKVPTTCYLGYVDDVPICVVETFSEEPCELFLTNFGIAKDVQKKGKGRLFIALFENLAKNKGYKKLRLTSHPDAYGFYLKCGYSRYGSGEYGLCKNI